MQTFNILILIAVVSGVSLAQWSGTRSPQRVNPAWLIEQPEAPDAYEAPEIPDALLFSAIRNDPGAHQAITNYRTAHRAAYDDEVSRYLQHFGNPNQRQVRPSSVQPAAPVRAPVTPPSKPAAPVQTSARPAPVSTRAVTVPTHRAPTHVSHASLYNFIEQPDPFEMLERPDAYEAPEIPDALLLSALRNDPGAYQAITNYRTAHRAAYDDKVNRYRQQFMPRASGHVGRAPTPGRQLPARVRTNPVPTKPASVQHSSMRTR